MDGWKERETYRGVGFFVFGRFVLLSSSSSLRDVGSVMFSMLCFLVLKADTYGGQAVGVRTKFGTGFAQKCYAYYIIIKHNIRALESLHSRATM